MSKPYVTPIRCEAIIPLSPFDGITCGRLADIIAQEGPRCDSCAAEFGFTPLTDESIAAEWAGAK